MVIWVISNKRIKELLDETEPLTFPLALLGSKKNDYAIQMWGYTEEELKHAREYGKKYYHTKVKNVSGNK